MADNDVTSEVVEPTDKVMTAVAKRPDREHELALVQRAAAGDRAAQREVFLAQRAAVHHALFRVLGSNRDIEDLVQDAFFAIFRALPSFRGESSLGRWCQTIAMRAAFTAIAKRKPVAVDLAVVEDVIPDRIDAKRQLQHREAARRLYAVLNRVEAKQRIAFALAVIDGRSLAEVAQLTETSVFAVKTRVWRARREIRRAAERDELLASYISELEGGEP